MMIELPNIAVDRDWLMAQVGGNIRPMHHVTIEDPDCGCVTAAVVRQFLRVEDFRLWAMNQQRHGAIIFVYTVMMLAPGQLHSHPAGWSVRIRAAAKLPIALIDSAAEQLVAQMEGNPHVEATRTEAGRSSLPTETVATATSG